MILDDIAKKTRQRIAKRKEIIDFITIHRLAEQMMEQYNRDDSKWFENSLQKSQISFICEVKQASPSQGKIIESNGDFPFCQIAKEYETAGADAISCLTEPYWFHGANEYLETIAQNVTIPVLRKDFTIDPYMIDEAKILRASAVLLIVAILTQHELIEYLRYAAKLGLAAIVETHTRDEVLRAIDCGARIIGVNNRDLKTMNVDIATCIRLRELVPSDHIYVAESGIRTAAEVAILAKNRVDAILIGETLMRAENRATKLKELRGEFLG